MYLMKHRPRRAALGGTTTSFSPRVPRRMPNLMLGSLGDDPPPDTTLSDPTLKWQAEVIGQLRAGVDTMKTAELQKWMQIAATVAIPVLGFAWKAVFPALFRKGLTQTGG
jgi:hypothetical protein